MGFIASDHQVGTGTVVLPSKQSLCDMLTRHRKVLKIRVRQRNLGG